MDLRPAIDTIESLIGDPANGLPEDVFLFVSRTTPMINVDLLIKDESGRTLLSWRNDGDYAAGWHIMGGIIRYRETIAQRIRAVAKTELGAEVEFEPKPLAINEVFRAGKRERGHFISLLYQCGLLTPPDERLQYKSGAPLSGQWMWHETCPENIISVHQIYREYI